MSKLGADAVKEQASQALAIDGRNAGGCEPANETESNSGDLSAEPVTNEAAQEVETPAFRVNTRHLSEWVTIMHENSPSHAGGSAGSAHNSGLAEECCHGERPAIFSKLSQDTLEIKQTSHKYAPDLSCTLLLLDREAPQRPATGAATEQAATQAMVSECW